MPCARHHFHFDCVSKWLAECRSACPLCGEDIAACASAASVSVGTEAKSGREELLPERERSSASTDRV